MVPRSQYMLFIILLIQVLYTHYLLQKVDVRLYQELNQVCRIKVVIKIFIVILVAASFNSRYYEAFLLFVRF